ncbi:MAG: hypothetical protein ACK5YO_27170, partial [Planctomyces sp.]
MGLSVPEDIPAESNRLAGGGELDDSFRTDCRAAAESAQPSVARVGGRLSGLSRRSWVSAGSGLLVFCLQTLLWLAIAAAALFLLGESQRRGWLPRGGSVVGGGSVATVGGHGDWICPMMCT